MFNCLIKYNPTYQTQLSKMIHNYLSARLITTLFFFFFWWWENKPNANRSLFSYCSVRVHIISISNHLLKVSRCLTRANKSLTKWQKHLSSFRRPKEASLLTPSPLKTPPGAVIIYDGRFLPYIRLLYPLCRTLYIWHTRDKALIFEAEPWPQSLSFSFHF